MPKTQNAFAFRDFDAARILQRLFFKEFREEYSIADNTDEKILEALTASDDDSLSILESKQVILKGLLKRTSKFRAWVDSHVKNRLGRYSRMIKKKIENGDPATAELLQKKLFRVQAFLIFNYTIDISEEIDNLVYDIGIKEDDIETEIQKRYQKIFATRLKAARLKAGLSRKALADIVNITQAAVGLYENCKREPTLTPLIRMSKVLGVTTDWLTGMT